jgi:adenylate cyclase
VIHALMRDLRRVNLPVIFNHVITVQKKGIRFPVFWQVTLSISVILFTALIVLWSTLHNSLQDLLHHQTDTFGQAIASQTAQSVADFVMSDDMLGLNTTINNHIEQNPNVVRIDVFNHKHDLLASARKNGLLELDEVSRYQNPIKFHDVLAGDVFVYMDKTYITQSIERSIQLLASVIIAVFILLMFVSALFARRVTDPIHALQDASRAVSLGKLNVQLPKASNDEIGDLVQAFAEMVTGLKEKESIAQTLGQYMPKDTARDILADLAHPRRPLRQIDASVLFVDMVGFTELCENTNPSQIATLLNQYYFLIHQCAHVYRGAVDKFIGDGAMVTFGATKEDHKHAINAVCAAQLFIRLTDDMNRRRKMQDLPILSFRLGLHCGEMLAGSIGSAERMEVTVVGDTINLASRLCNIAEPAKLLISEAVYKHPSCLNMLTVDDAQIIKIKGKREPIVTYNVCYLAAKFNRLLHQQETELVELQNHA